MQSFASCRTALVGRRVACYVSKAPLPNRVMAQGARQRSGALSLRASVVLQQGSSQLGTTAFLSPLCILGARARAKAGRGVVTLVSLSVVCPSSSCEALPSSSRPGLPGDKGSPGGLSCVRAALCVPLPERMCVCRAAIYSASDHSPKWQFRSSWEGERPSQANLERQGERMEEGLRENV